MIGIENIGFLTLNINININVSKHNEHLITIIDGENNPI